MEQKATLKSWERGACKGLLSDPDLPALSLSQVTDTQPVIVLGAANSIETEDADKIARFRWIASASSAGGAIA